MAIKLGDAILFLAANDKELTATLNKTEKTVEKFTEKTNTLGGRIGNMFSSSLGQMVAFGAGMFSVSQIASFVVNEISDNQRAAQQLNAVLQSTGGVAGVTAEQVNGLSTRLAELSNFSDDAVVSASSLMLTFTNVSSNVFPRAMQAVVDMATALDVDLKGAVIKVGKALNDPVKGMAALSESGIQFSQAQKDMITNYIESNDLMSAQSVILAELERQMGGSAAASTGTFAGSVQDLKDALGDLAAELEPVLNFVNRLINGFTALAKIIKEPFEALKVMTGYYNELDEDATKRLEFSKATNKNLQRQQMMEHGANLMTAEGITREEYDAKYAAAEAAAQAEAEKQASTEAKKLKPEERDMIAARTAYAALVRGEPEQGPLTMEESARDERDRYQSIRDGGRSLRDAQAEAKDQTLQNLAAYGGRGMSSRQPRRRDINSVYGIASQEQLNEFGKNAYNMQQDQGVVSGGGRRGVNNVIISHANFTAGPDQVRAYNQRRAMMPGVP